MDHMDIDQVVEIPDTPDRFTRQGINGRMGAILENHCSSNPFHEQQPLSEESFRDQPMVIDSGNKGRFLRPAKRANSPINSRRPNTSSDFPSASLSSSRNTLIFRKRVTEKNPRHLSHDSLHKQHLPVMRPPSTRQSSFLQNDGFPDPTEGNFHKPAFGNASIRGMPGNNQSNFLKRSGLANGTSSHGLAVTNLSPASSNASEETNNVIKVSSSTTTNEGLDFDDNWKPGSGGLLPRNPIASPRVNRQKRLVRNGCISPNNIAKAKQLPRKDIDSSVAATHDNGFETSSARPISTDIIMELVAEDNDAHSRKGKGVISLPCSSKGPDFQNKNLHTRRRTSFDEKAKSTEESGGWRSTHNQTRDIKMPSHDQEHFLIKDTDNLRCPTQHHETRSQRSGKGIRVASGDDYSKELSNISSERVHTSREPPSSHSARLGRLNAPRAADLLIKRQKQVSNSSSRGECSRPVSDDPEVIFLSSSAEAGNSKSTASNVGNLQKIIEVDETSPQLARNDHDEDVRSRQVEADELLARELQEQFYNEVPVFGEVDDHIALALQQQEGSSHGFPRGRRPVPEARSTANLHRQFQARSSVNAPRRGAPTRASTLGRMTRLRNRFPGQGRTLLPSRGRTSMFPPDMDVDMRMFILGALEEFSDMEMNTGLLQADRDFNEDDYEMLLALDENNHEHGGASIHRINGLPQSTVQSDCEEACAICLDTLTIGDTIRHLPCLHKFHKDCIDPWLRRRSSCPVCKSDIA